MIFHKIAPTFEIRGQFHQRYSANGLAHRFGPKRCHISHKLLHTMMSDSKISISLSCLWTLDEIDPRWCLQQQLQQQQQQRE